MEIYKTLNNTQTLKKKGMVVTINEPARLHAIKNSLRRGKMQLNLEMFKNDSDKIT